MKLSQWPSKIFIIKEYKLTISGNKFSSNPDLEVSRYSHSKFDEIHNSQFHSISCPILSKNSAYLHIAERACGNLGRGAGELSLKSISLLH